MDRHHHKRRRRSCSPDQPLSGADTRHKVFKRELRSSSRSGDERDTVHVVKSKHHHAHKHHHREKHRSEKDNGSHVAITSDRDRRRNRENRGSSGKARRDDEDSSVQERIRQEPSDEYQDRGRPSSSKRNSDGGYDRNRRGQGDLRGDKGDGPGYRKKPFIKKEEDTTGMEWGKKVGSTEKKICPPEERDKPNFGLSGKLTEDRNTYKGVVIKYSEPPEARVPKRRWRLYPFKGDEGLKVIYLHRASAYLLGRDRKVVDIPLDHPSCSKQHAALQYRLVNYTRDDGSIGKRIRPYVIDLESANGTFVNNQKVEPKKYVELMERDVIKFGFSSREYVLLHENSKDEQEDDNA